MKFGLECEKFLFDQRLGSPSEGVYRFVDAFYEQRSEDPLFGKTVTNEFVLNMIELVTRPSERPLDVVRELVSHYLLARKVAAREAVSLVPLASLPMDFMPHLTPKWAYLVQNSILAGERQHSWMMDRNSPLRPAGNCAGVHVHVELETSPEFHFNGRELQDKFNLALMLTPMIAFSSSPWFFGEGGAASMRGRAYYERVYKNFPLNGGLPPVMSSSQEVLLYFLAAAHNWVEKGVGVGFTREDMVKLTRDKGAHWNPVRWNKHWNTIELRCLDSDRLDLDAAKFMWIYGAMKRLDLKGESLQTSVLSSHAMSLEEMVEGAFEISGNKVSILDTQGIASLFSRAIQGGLEDELVASYLDRLSAFLRPVLSAEERWFTGTLDMSLRRRSCTATELVKRYGSELKPGKAVELVRRVVEAEDLVLPQLIERCGRGAGEEIGSGDDRSAVLPWNGANAGDPGHLRV